jgi:anti-sigma factor RsiW
MTDGLAGLEVTRGEVAELLASQGDGRVTVQRIRQVEVQALAKVQMALLGRFGATAPALLLDFRRLAPESERSD